MLIFDRYLSLKTEEHQLFKKAGSKLFSPALNYYKDFIYLPFSVKIKDKKTININPVGEKRRYSVIYKGRLLDRTTSFEKYLLVFHKEIHPSVAYSSTAIKKEKEQEYFSLGLPNTTVLQYSDSDCCIILGSGFEYRVGYLDCSFIEALQYNCIPLIVSENRFYNGFPTVVYNPIDIMLYYNTYDNTHFGMMYELYETIRNKYPEMSVEYTTSIIKYALK